MECITENCTLSQVSFFVSITNGITLLRVSGETSAFSIKLSFSFFFSAALAFADHRFERAAFSISVSRVSMTPLSFRLASRLLATQTSGARAHVGASSAFGAFWMFKRRFPEVVGWTMRSAATPHYSLSTRAVWSRRRWYAPSWSRVIPECSRVFATA